MQPQYPQYPQQFQAPPVPQYPGGYYPPQQVPQQFAPPVQPAVAGTLDGFYEQPSSASGPSWKFKDKPLGTSYAGIVARAVTNADVEQQTNQQGVPQTFKDGRPKLVMKVPMTVMPSPEYPEGQSQWYVKGQARDELARAMEEAGAPAGTPEPGAAIQVTLVGHRPIPGFNPQFLYRVAYQRPTNAPAAAAPVEPVTAPAPTPVSAPVAAPAQQPMQVPPGLDPAQQELLARLTGQPSG